MGKLKVLVLGDGLLGSEIVKQTNWDFYSRRKNNFDINKIDTILPKNLDVIVNCIANTDTYSNDRISHWNVN
jgi:dTDP-4-dehydrorhamnose reductase